MTLDDRVGTTTHSAAVRPTLLHQVPPAPLRRRHRWQVAYLTGVVLTDTLAVLAAGSTAILVRFGSAGGTISGGASYWVGLALCVPLWVATVAVTGAYGLRVVGGGIDEYKRVLDAALRFSAVVITVSYATQVELARLALLAWLPLTAVLALGLRCLARRVLAESRRHGLALRRVLVVGCETSAFALATRLERAPDQGFLVVGVCAQTGRDRRQDVTATALVERRRTPHDPPVVGSIDDTPRLVRDLGADVIAVAPGGAVSSDGLRELAWQVEDTGVDVLVAPALVDVAGPRLHVAPVDGQPLVHVQTPQLQGPRALVKTVFDRCLALAVLAAVVPLLLVAAALVRLEGDGPVLFRQTRVGRGGRLFTILKLRSMRVGADAELDHLWTRNRHVDGPLFKMVDDPRITRIGRHLRRWSIDELPQLLNVLRGDMSLVGPRPPLPSEVDRYEHPEVFRRLMVRPGLTGLWQVSGRSSLDWTEAVRLDLYYVDNWSLTFDVSILAKTAGAVLRGSGAH